MYPNMNANLLADRLDDELFQGLLALNRSPVLAWVAAHPENIDEAQRLKLDGLNLARQQFFSLNDPNDPAITDAPDKLNVASVILTKPHIFQSSKIEDFCKARVEGLRELKELVKDPDLIAQLDEEIKLLTKVKEALRYPIYHHHFSEYERAVPRVQDLSRKNGYESPVQALDLTGFAERKMLVSIEKDLFSEEELAKPLKERQIKLENVEAAKEAIAQKRAILEDLKVKCAEAHGLLRDLPNIEALPPADFIADVMFQTTHTAMGHIREMHGAGPNRRFYEGFDAAVHPDLLKEYEEHLNRLSIAVEMLSARQSNPHIALEKQTAVMEIAGFPESAKSNYFSEKIKPDAFAAQVKEMATLIQACSRQKFSEWDTYELVNNPDSVGAYFKDFLNGLTNFVHKHILEHPELKDRARAWEFWVHVASALIEMGDYSSGMMIATALESPKVNSKLPRSTGALSDLAQQKFDDLRDYHNKNGARARAGVAGDPMAIPNVGLMAKDVIMLKEKGTHLLDEPVVQAKMRDLLLRRAMLAKQESSPSTQSAISVFETQAYNTNENVVYATADQYKKDEKPTVPHETKDRRLKRANSLLSAPLKDQVMTLRNADQEEAMRLQEIARGLRFSAMHLIQRAVQRMTETQPFQISNNYGVLANSLMNLERMAEYADSISQQVVGLVAKLAEQKEQHEGEEGVVAIIDEFRDEAMLKHAQYERLLQMNVNLLLKAAIQALEKYPTLDEAKRATRGDIQALLLLEMNVDTEKYFSPENKALYEQFQAKRDALKAQVPAPAMQAVPPAPPAPLNEKEDIATWVNGVLPQSTADMQRDEKYGYSTATVDDIIHTKFSDDSHALVRTRDFESIMKHYRRTVDVLAAELKLTPEQLAYIHEGYEQIVREILEKCDIDELMRGYKQACYSSIPVNLTREPEFEKAIFERVELAVQYGKKFIAFAVRELYPDSIKSAAAFKEKCDLFVNKANDLTADRKRNRLIHEFKLNDGDAATYYSVHDPIQDRTISSHRRDPGEVANAGRRSFGVERDGKVEIQFTARTHCSYSPSTEAPKYQVPWAPSLHGVKHLYELARQRQAAYQAELKFIESVAQEQLERVPLSEGAGTEASPLVLEMSSMCLLTSAGLDDKLLILKDNETRQVQNNSIATALARSRPHEMWLNVNGVHKTVVVQPNINFMSRTCNIVGALISPSEEANQINDRGYAEYTQLAYTHLLENLPLTLPNDPDSKMADRLRQSVGNVLAQFQAPWAELQRKLGKIDLDAQYRELEKIQERFIAAYEIEEPDEAEVNRLAKEYDQAYRHIKATERKQHEYYRTFVEQQWKITKDSRLRDPNLRNDLQEYLAINHKQLTPAQRDALTMFQALEDSCSLYNGEEDHYVRLMYEFETRFLLVSDLMERDVDFYCKSARDRTGREQQMTEEMLIFRDQYGYLPRLDTKKTKVLRHTIVTKNEEDDVKQREIALKVHEFSTSRSISEMNTPGGRGIKVHNTWTKGIGPVNVTRTIAANTTLPVKVERKFAEAIQETHRKNGIQDRLYTIDDCLNPAIAQLLNKHLPEEMSILEQDALVHDLNNGFAYFQIRRILEAHHIPISAEDRAEIIRFQPVVAKLKKCPELVKDYIIHNLKPEEIAALTTENFAVLRQHPENLEFVAAYLEDNKAQPEWIEIQPGELSSLQEEFVYSALSALALLHQSPAPTEEWLTRMRDYANVLKMSDDELTALIEEAIPVKYLGVDELQAIRDEAQSRYVGKSNVLPFPETEHLLRRSKKARQSVSALLDEEEDEFSEHEFTRVDSVTDLVPLISATRRGLDRKAKLQRASAEFVELQSDLVDERDTLEPVGGMSELDDELYEVRQLNQRLLPETNTAWQKFTAWVSLLKHKVGQFFESIANRGKRKAVSEPPEEPVEKRFRLRDRVRQLFSLKGQEPVDDEMEPLLEPVVPVVASDSNLSRNRQTLADLDAIRRSDEFRADPDAPVDLLHNALSQSVSGQTQAVHTRELFERERQPMRVEPVLQQPSVSMRGSMSMPQQRVERTPEPFAVAESAPESPKAPLKAPNRLDIIGRNTTLLSQAKGRVEVKTGVRNYYSPLMELSTQDHMNNPLYHDEVKLLMDMLRDLVAERIAAHQRDPSKPMKKEVIIGGNDTQTLVGVAAALVQAVGFTVKWESPEIEAKATKSVNITTLQHQLAAFPGMEDLIADVRQVEEILSNVYEPNDPDVDNNLPTLVK